jgi:hypothetical protein
MKRIALAVMISLFAAGTAAASCKSEAAAKKLAGAAEKSFMTKCEKDAMASCDASAMKQKLAGAAKSSYTKKCVSDAVGK